MVDDTGIGSGTWLSPMVAVFLVVNETVIKGTW